MEMVLLTQLTFFECITLYFATAALILEIAGLGFVAFQLWLEYGQDDDKENNNCDCD